VSSSTVAEVQNDGDTGDELGRPSPIPSSGFVNVDLLVDSATTGGVEMIGSTKVVTAGRHAR
jgi:hypothetical protein